MVAKGVLMGGETGLKVTEVNDDKVSHDGV